MALITYPDGAPFAGVMGRTTDRSTPAWPEPRRAQAGSPNILFFVLDDVGFGQLAPFGGLVETPVLERLANEGLRYTNMHTTAVCSPSRACVLTGRNHHSVGIACITEASTGYPGYNGQMPFEKAMLSEMLLPMGYNTFCVGKWHLTPAEDITGAGPFDRWPLGRGFERYYGFLGGETNQWYPELTYDNHQVEQPALPEDGYHLSADLADKAIEFIKDAHTTAPDKPFFLYYATGAGHAPHHVPKEWADKYQGMFDAGWDAYREIVHQRQIDMGIIPADTALSAHDPDVPAWDSLSADAKRLSARFMEVYAGFLEYTDHHFGRILDFLDEIGERDNTLVIVVSDNGASSEGGAVGSLNEMFFFNNAPESLEDNLAMIDQLGGVETCNHYPWGWANAGNAPFRRWKRETYRGGTSDPCIVSWPARITDGGAVRSQYGHVIDFVPTVLESLGLQPPEAIRGVPQAPIEGVSFAHTFTDAAAPSRHETQYFEMMGHRAIYHEGWRAVCPWPGPSFTEAAERGLHFGSPIPEETLNALESSGWELYNLAEDWSETRNVAGENPEKLAELVALWWAEAERYQVLPVDGDVLYRLSVEKPSGATAADKFVMYPGGAPLPFTANPKTYNRPWSLTAEVTIPAGGAEGVLVANGGRTGGYTFFVKDQKLHFLYNWLGSKHFWLRAPDPLPEGDLELRYEFEPLGAPNPAAGLGVPARGQLYVNGTLVASIDMPFSVLRMFGTQGLTCGYDGGEPAAPEEYTGSYPFTGTIKRVTIDLSGELLADTEGELRVAMARQ